MPRLSLSIKDVRKITVQLQLPMTNIARVTTMKVLGVTLTNSLSVAEHVQAGISSCAQTLYALRILRAHSMDDSDLQTVYRSVVIAKFTYASSAWWGFTSATDRQRLDAFIRRSERSHLVPPNLPSFAEPCHTADERLFNQILSNSLTKHMCSTIFFHRHQWPLTTTIYASDDIT